MTIGAQLIIESGPHGVRFRWYCLQSIFTYHRTGAIALVVPQSENPQLMITVEWSLKKLENTKLHKLLLHAIQKLVPSIHLSKHQLDCLRSLRVRFQVGRSEFVMTVRIFCLCLLTIQILFHLLYTSFYFLQNLGLRQEMERLKKENLTLRDRLSKFTEI